MFRTVKHVDGETISNDVRCPIFAICCCATTQTASIGHNPQPLLAVRETAPIDCNDHNEQMNPRTFPSTFGSFKLPHTTLSTRRVPACHRYRSRLSLRGDEVTLEQRTSYFSIGRLHWILGAVSSLCTGMTASCKKVFK